jgi:hypothetical protein
MALSVVIFEQRSGVELAVNLLCSVSFRVFRSFVLLALLASSETYIILVREIIPPRWLSGPSVFCVLGNSAFLRMFFDAPFSLFHGSLFSREHFFFFLADIFFFKRGVFSCGR